MNKCSHKEKDNGYYAWVEDDWTGESEYTYVDGDTRSTWVDIDLHRAQCSKCGDISYYSQAAREFYEKGIQNPYIKGLSE